MPLHRLSSLFLIATLLSPLSIPTKAAAQGVDEPTRLELGRRMQDLERTWLATPDQEARARAVPTITQALRHWFAADFFGVNRELVKGEALLRKAEGASAIDLWAGAITITPTERIFAPPEEGASLHFPFRVGTAYADTSPPEGALIEIEGLGRARLSLAIDSEMREFSVTPGSDEPGDYEITIRVLHNGKVLRTFRDRLSIIERLDARLAVLRGTLRAVKPGKDGVASAETTTALGIVQKLRATKYGLDVENPIRAAEELARAERLAIHAEAGTRSPERAAPGDRWLRLQTGDITTPCRIRVPNLVKKTKGDAPKLPLVVAVHGMGGSENLFFEAHGLGLGPDLAEARGWLFAAPGGLDTPGRGAQIGEIVTALERFLPIDRDRIYLIGHSLGAARIVAATSDEPARYRAIAPLSGGGAIAPGVDLKGLPSFVAAGKEDFGLGMSLSVKSVLERANAAVTYREYSPSEHMMMVPDSLPEVFAFFDQHSEKRNHSPTPATGKIEESEK